MKKKDFKYQVTLKVVLKKKNNGEIEFRPVYFDSKTKTVINHKFSIENAFQEISYRIDNWINEGSAQIIELIESQYINISTYRPLSGSSYLDLSVELRSPIKGLINLRLKMFLWCHVRHVNPSKERPERIKKTDKKKLLKKLIMMELSFQCKKKILERLK